MQIGLLKYFLLVPVISVMLNNQCNKPVDGIPACVISKIDSIKKEPKWNPPAEVKEYEYKNQRVFLFSSNCCDQFIMLYDGSCNYICAPSGGFTGKGDGKCSEFYKEAKFLKLVWKDDR
ncbi:MAG: hypothetical protein QM764_05345 [Chitinophagaceae bacterium]